MWILIKKTLQRCSKNIDQSYYLWWMNADIVLGVITIDDVDVVVEEASEDILKLSGTSGGDDIQSSKLIQQYGIH